MSHRQRLTAGARKGVKKTRAASSEPDDFVSVARRLECDEDKSRFEEALRKIVRAKPKGPIKGSRAGINASSSIGFANYYVVKILAFQYTAP